jgi:uncharacterized protein (TIRG00374 family)
MEKKGIPNWLKIVPGILFSVLAVFAVLKFVNPQDLRDAFSTVSIKFILAIAAMNVASLLLRGKAWQTILDGKIRFWDSFFGVSEGYFLNNILPFRAGEFGRSFFVGRKSGLGTFYTLSSIVIERAFDIAFAALLIVVTLPNLNGMEWAKPIAIVALVLVFIGMVCLFLLTRNKEKVLAWVGKLEGKSRFFDVVVPMARNVIEGFSTIRRPSQFFLSLFWIALCWGVWVALYYLTVIQVLPGQPLWTGAFIASVLALGVAIPSAPAALGVFEAAVTGAVVLLGGTAGSAFGYALIVHLTHFVVVGILGMWGLARDQVSFSTLVNDVLKRRESSPETRS